MRIIYAGSYKRMSEIAAGIIVAQVTMKPDAVLGLATGSTPLGVYSRMIEQYHNDQADFSEATVFNLDEYCGLAPEAEQSYFYFMKKNLFSKVNFPRERLFIPDGLAADLYDVCTSYDAAITSHGGIDLQLLGIGMNGHIGFNEPGTEFIPETHLVDLSESTIQANSRFFQNKSEVPVQAITMGIRSIMQARKILLIVSGEEKAKIVRQAIFGPISPEVPASILQLHGDLTVVGDGPALARL